jgi:hypothetical protein
MFGKMRMRIKNQSQVMILQEETQNQEVSQERSQDQNQKQLEKQERSNH